MKLFDQTDGADIESVNNNDETPLYLAVKETHVETVELLFGKSKPKRGRKQMGSMPLHTATTRK